MASCPHLLNGCGLRETRMPTDKITQPGAHGLRTAFARAGERSFHGFAFNPEDRTQRLVVEIIVDGRSVKAVRADAYVHELAREEVGDGCYGFSLALDDAVLC